MQIRTLALAAHLAITLAVSGCSSGAEPTPTPSAERTDGDHSAEDTEQPAESPTEAVPVVHTKIPRPTRDVHFPSPEQQYLNWLSIAAARPPSAIIRRVLPCDDAQVNLGIDRRTLAHAETVVEQDGYLISRQLTLYPDPATADKFVSQLSESPIGCRKLMGSSDLGGAQRLDYARDEFFGTRQKSIIFSETDLTYGENRFLFIDIVNQRDNAIMFTRVGMLNPRIKSDGVLMAKEQNPRFVRQVRGEGDRGTAILRELSR